MSVCVHVHVHVVYVCLYVYVCTYVHVHMCGYVFTCSRVWWPDDNLSVISQLLSITIFKQCLSEPCCFGEADCPASSRDPRVPTFPVLASQVHIVTAGFVHELWEWIRAGLWCFHGKLFPCHVISLPKC